VLYIHIIRLSMYAVYEWTSFSLMSPYLFSLSLSPNTLSLSSLSNRYPSSLSNPNPTLHLNLRHPFSHFFLYSFSPFRQLQRCRIRKHFCLKTPLDICRNGACFWNLKWKWRFFFHYILCCIEPFFIYDKFSYFHSPWTR